MPRIKKSNSFIIEMAAKRSAGLESIDPALDLGNGLTLAAYKAALGDAQAKMSAYNTLLSDVDNAGNAFHAAEKNLRDLNDRVLAGVAARYGRDSSAYEQAGGTRKSERKRPVRKQKVPLAAGA